MLYNKQVTCDHLKVFGCLCFASTLTRGTKFEARAKRSVMVGYSETQKGYKLFDLESGTFFVSRDAVFREDNFPFKGLQEEDNEVFEIPPPESPFFPLPSTMQIPAKHVPTQFQTSDAQVQPLDVTALGDNDD